MVKKPKWKQAIVLFGGIFFNFVFAWILISLAFTFGVPASREDYSQYSDRITDSRIAITQVSQGSPAYKSGIKPGDSIVKVEHGSIVLEKDSLNIPVIKDAINRNGNQLSMVLKRGDSYIKTNIIPEKGIIEGKYAVGIVMEDVGTMRLPFGIAIYESGKFTLHMISGVAKGLFDLVFGIFSGRPDLSSVSGPIGIAGLVGDAAKLGFTYLIMFTALISINLGVINLVPFPALDGGRLFVLLVEAIRRKPIPSKVVNMINTVGFVLLLGLMLLVTFKDLFKFF